MTKIEAIEKAIARYVSRGYNNDSARKYFAEDVLADLHWMPVELVARTLTHFDFATRGQAPIMAAALKAA